MLTNAWKVERNYFDTHILSETFFRECLIEGLQQAVDTRLPQVSIHRRFKTLVEDELDELVGNATRLVAHPQTTHTIHGQCAKTKAQRICLAIGPEGGWTDYELDMLKIHGFLPVSMGKRILRSDTACVALLALVLSQISPGGVV